MRYRLTRSARRDLEEISSYSTERWGAERAKVYLSALIARFAWLPRNRSLWRAREDIREGLFSYRESQHIIYFRSHREGIEIVRVLHARMDPDRHL